MATDLATRQQRTYTYNATNARLRAGLRDLARYSAAFKRGGAAELSRIAGVHLDEFAVVGVMIDIANGIANIRDEMEARRAERAVA